MRSYGQFCGLARALDVVGDRWTLLVVRELLVAPRRYSDLKAALPGAASNLLVARLRTLEREGIVVSRDVPPPTPARLYELTPLGRALEPSVLALTRWGGHRMTRGAGTDLFRPDWLVVALRALLAHRAGAQTGRLDAVLHVGDGSVTVAVRPGAIDVQLGTSATADVVMQADPETALAVACGSVALDEAVVRGRVTVHGPARATKALGRLFRA